MDGVGYMILRLELDSGEYIVLAGTGVRDETDGSGDKASFYDPFGVAISQDGDTLYVTDNNGFVRKVTGVQNAQDLSKINVATIAGGGYHMNVGDAPVPGEQCKFYIARWISIIKHRGYIVYYRCCL